MSWPQEHAGRRPDDRVGGARDPVCTRPVSEELEIQHALDHLMHNFQSILEAQVTVHLILI
jgi:hypothetical protein